MNSTSQATTFSVPPWLDLLWGAAVLAILSSMLVLPVAGTRTATIILTAGVVVTLYSTIALSVMTHWPKHQDFGWANRVTLLRGCIIIVLVAIAVAMATGALLPAGGLWWYTIAALLALMLDGVDGQLARRTNSCSEFGARFDMELDTLFILGLCLAVFAMGIIGPWVLALGLMRYGFVAATWALPWMNQPLPPSLRRKTVCVWQVVTLMVAIVPIVPALLVSTSLAIALLLLTLSFSIDVFWLYQRRHDYEAR